MEKKKPREEHEKQALYLVRPWARSSVEIHPSVDWSCLVASIMTGTAVIFELSALIIEYSALVEEILKPGWWEGAGPGARGPVDLPSSVNTGESQVMLFAAGTMAVRVVDGWTAVAEIHPTAFAVDIGVGMREVYTCLSVSYFKMAVSGNQRPGNQWVHTDPLAFGGPRPVYTLRYLESLAWQWVRQWLLVGKIYTWLVVGTELGQEPGLSLYAFPRESDLELPGVV
eukprot:Skav207723  [mRNA]  locus=scaffold362:59235:64113:- [translate_table: standard]